MPQIGVLEAHCLDDDAQLKRAALLFNKIGIVGMGALRVFGSDFARDRERLQRKLDFLLSAGVALEPLPHEAILYQQLMHEFSKRMSEDRTVADSHAATERPLTLEILKEHDRRTRELLFGMFHDLSRKVAADYSGLSGEKAVVVSSAAPSSHGLIAGDDRVAEVVIRELPLPTEATPWEDVLAFRSDETLRASYHRLHHWMNRAAAPDREIGVLRDELRSMLSDYAAHIRLQRLKFARSGLRAFFTILAGAFRIGIGWGVTDAIDGLFGITERRVTLLEAERVSPGREVAYIFDVDERFSRM